MHRHHDNSKLSPHTRKQIRENSGGLTIRELSAIHHVSVATIHKWQHQEDPRNGSCRPKHIKTAFTAEQEKLLVGLRGHGLSLDEIADAAQAAIPGATRSSIYRMLKRHCINRLPSKPKPPHGEYSKSIAPGFLHIDSFKLVRVVGQSVSQHCFVAVDRATRMVLTGVYDRHNSDAACDFHRRCQVFFPFKLHTIVTDNGGEYTLKATCPPKHAKGHRRPFELLCAEAGIEHRTTRPYTPKTNGLVERMNGEIQNKVTRNKKYAFIEERDSALRAWNENYNKNRRNRNIPIGLMTPLEAAARWFEKNTAQAA